MRISKGKKLLALGVALVVIDQVIKVLVKTNMTLGESIDVIGDWFKIYFIENEGMAFGMKWGGKVGKFLLSLFRIGLFAALVYWVTQLVRKDEAAAQSVPAASPRTPTGVLVGLTMIAAGALGNIFDCYFYGLIFSESTYTTVAQLGGRYAPFMFGRVVDMFYFPLIDTTFPDWLPLIGGHPFRFFAPVFNFADACVSVGAIYLIFFQYKFFMKEEAKDTPDSTPAGKKSKKH